MSEANFASLNPTLLARKGGAKPAMRPQLAPLPEDAPEEDSSDALEDLGWNDMGGEAEHEKAEQGEVESAQIFALKPDSGSGKRTAKKTASSSKKTANITGHKGRRVAFTLRLDPERHLKLKLAATMEGLSAQALVTEALDAKFAEISDLEALIGRIKRN